MRMNRMLFASVVFLALASIAGAQMTERQALHGHVPAALGSCSQPAGFRGQQT